MFSLIYTYTACGTGSVLEAVQALRVECGKGMPSEMLSSLVLWILLHMTGNKHSNVLAAEPRQGTTYTPFT